MRRIIKYFKEHHAAQIGMLTGLVTLLLAIFFLIKPQQSIGSLRLTERSWNGF